MNSGSIVMADSAPNLQCFMNVTVAPLAAAGIFNGSITCNGARAHLGELLLAASSTP